MLKKTQYTYTTVVKNQKNNPFTRQDRHQQLQNDLSRRLGWLVQLQQTPGTAAQEFWEAMTTPHKMFGRSSLHQKPNTGLSALGGACEKLAHGDLSLKQLNNIMPVLKAMSEYWPELWSEIEFQDQTEPEPQPTKALFDF